MAELTMPVPPTAWTEALEVWTWLDDDERAVGQLRPWFANRFGDVILVRDGDPRIWLLDTSISGELSAAWPDRAALEAELQTGAGQEQYLLATLVAAAEESGGPLGPGEVVTFAAPPVLGGDLTPDNLGERLDLDVWLYLAGQLHQQVAQLPPDADVSGFTISDP